MYAATRSLDAYIASPVRKLRDKVTVPVDMTQAELEAVVLARPKIVAVLEGKAPLKVIHAGGRLVNTVVR